MQHFANGYWLGEMLSKLNLQPDFDRFEDRRTPEVMLKNYARLQVCDAAFHARLLPSICIGFCHCLMLSARHAYGLVNAFFAAPEPKHPALQPTFTKLHVPFTSQTAKQLMRGDKGAAAQLLYGVKSAVDRDGSADSVGPNPTKLAATFGFKMPLSRGLLESDGYRQAASAAVQALLYISSGPRPVSDLPLIMLCFALQACNSVWIMRGSRCAHAVLLQFLAADNP